MKVIIIGAAGAIGSHVLTSCLKRNFTVTAFVRSPSKIPQDLHTNPNLTIIQGDASDKAALISAISGHDAVVQAAVYGVDFVLPWTDLTPSLESEKVVAAVVDAAVEIQSRRSKDGGNPLRFWNVSGQVVMDYPPNNAKLLSDIMPLHPEHKANWQYLVKHGETLDWSLICPGMIEKGEPRGPLEVTTDIPGLWVHPWIIPGRLPFIGPYFNIIYNWTQTGVTFGTLGEFVADNLGPGGELSKKRVGVLENRHAKR
ncbi:hypothetical protein DL96DRAFT_1820616 [Flagelloscypha sp. PMI_526]|nr:hypothetical protein DL96DRAFT_1820616 [Flagelloscypha sp. PMI_526]